MAAAPNDASKAAYHRAAQAADMLGRELRDDAGRLLRSWKDGTAQHAAVLEDHAHLADGLLALYEATFDERWFVEARRLADLALDHFGGAEGQSLNPALNVVVVAALQ